MADQPTHTAVKYGTAFRDIIAAAAASPGRTLTLTDIHLGQFDAITFDVTVIDAASFSHAEYRAVCEHCGKSFIAERKRGRFCQPNCRIASHRARKRADEQLGRALTDVEWGWVRTGLSVIEPDPTAPDRFVLVDAPNQTVSP